ncbi:polysaccharide pyruvyl transferase family protein [Micropruina sp. KQZ13P-5]|nr:polysaccharide pyruvyl transferase family protein [Micropruina sp. KQZ13P-5]MCW3158746.1 polysaccharide pyruvyl transferase family protein [Micropruina sp. KQZ13P-5]
MNGAGIVLWAQERTANLGVAALAAGTRRLGNSAWPDMTLTTQYFADGTAPATIASPKLLLKDLVLDNVGLRRWLRQHAVALDTRMGDSFADIYGLHRLRNLVAMGEFARRSGIPLVLTPQTIGPFKTRQGRLLGALSVRRADLVLCRDPVSAEVASDLGCKNPILATDVVFALDTPPPQGSYDVLVNVSGLLWNTDSHGPSTDYRSIVRTVVDALRRAGREVTLLAHVLDAPTVDNDVPVVRALGKEWNLQVAIPSGLDQVRSILGGAQLLIGSRMHACLNSLSVGTPAIALAYSRKFAPLLTQLKWPGVVALSSPQAAEQAVELALRGDLAALVPRTRRLADEALGAATAALRDLPLRKS